MAKTKTNPKTKSSMKIALAIFAKTIGFSVVKTRLAESIGIQKAEEFYQLCLNSIEELVLNIQVKYRGLLIPYWAIAENQAIDKPQWQTFNSIWTGNGGLGERLDNVYSQLLKNHDYVMLIGTDSPQLQPEFFNNALEHIIKNRELVIGPCTDGGFYLFGGGIEIDRSIWVNTQYSQSDTMNQLIENLKPQTPHLLPLQQDVDVLEDIYTLSNILENSKISASQTKLRNWIGENIK